MLHNGLPIHFSMTDFYEQFGKLLVNVNSDSVESGDYRFFPEEVQLAEEYESNGYRVATIWEAASETEEETVSFEFEKGYDHPFVTGYMILQPKPETKQGLFCRNVA